MEQTPPDAQPPADLEWAPLLPPDPAPPAAEDDAAAGDLPPAPAVELVPITDLDQLVPAQGSAQESAHESARPVRVIDLARLAQQPTLRAIGIATLVAVAVGGPLGAASRQVSWNMSGSHSAGDEAWMNSLTGPVVATPGGPATSAGPDAAVLPLGGDPRTLVLTDQSAAQAGTGSPDNAALPPQINLNAAPVAGETAVTAQLAASGIPVRTLKAYLAAADITARKSPDCRLHWSLLAGIGRVESNHGRFGGASISDSGVVSPPIYGPRLTGGSGMATIRDTDGGRWDRDPAYDRAVGPMQFIPGTWKAYGSDADGDGEANPQDVDDAALSAARYLCLGGLDLSTQTGRWSAVLRYNRSNSYAAHVLSLADSYRAGKLVPVTTAPPNVALPTGSLATAGPRPTVTVTTTSTIGTTIPGTTGTATGTATTAVPVPTVTQTVAVVDPFPTATTTTASTTTTTPAAPTSTTPSTTTSTTTTTTTTTVPATPSTTTSTTGSTTSSPSSTTPSSTTPSSTTPSTTGSTTVTPSTTETTTVTTTVTPSETGTPSATDTSPSSSPVTQSAAVSQSAPVSPSATATPAATVTPSAS